MEVYFYKIKFYNLIETSRFQVVIRFKVCVASLVSLQFGLRDVISNGLLLSKVITLFGNKNDTKATKGNCAIRKIQIRAESYKGFFQPNIMLGWL